MTTLIAWAAIDQNLTTAVYVASDSRLTWGSIGSWNFARKVFASQKYPEILGYTGDALFCSQVLSQLVDYIDICAPIGALDTFDAKFFAIRTLLERAFSSYPKDFCLPNFSVLYLTRVGKTWGSCTFDWSLEGGWSSTTVHAIPATAKAVRESGANDAERTKSVMFVCDGSGGAAFRAYYLSSVWGKDLPLLSRSIFGAFCDFISSGEDSKSGGFPQLSCLYNSRPAQNIGYVHGERRYLFGIELDPSAVEDSVRWVNRTFENCEPRSGLRRPGAQRQPAPY